MAVDFVLTGTATYIVTGTVTKIEAIGPGADGQTGLSVGAGGGGGEYAAKNDPANVSGTRDVQVGAGGSANDTWFKDNSGTIICRANRGSQSGLTPPGGTGGVGDVTYNGGAGGTSGTSAGGGAGGGGAAGPNGPGAAGGSNDSTGGNGGGGGGANNGSAGQTGTQTAGGSGGASGLGGSSGGSGATTSANATSGTLGGGGGGAFNATRNAAAGSSGNEWDTSHGCGGGGGGGGGYEFGGGLDGASGGNYGGGGGAGGCDMGEYTDGIGGGGGDGLLIITYTTGATLAVVLHSDVIDNGLNEIVNDATTIFMCSANPGSYTDASSTFKLGSAAISFNNPAATSPPDDGRLIESDPITGGSITGSGTVTHWGVCDASRLLAAGEIDEGEVVTSGYEFTLGAFQIVLPFGP